MEAFPQEKQLIFPLLRTGISAGGSWGGGGDGGEVSGGAGSYKVERRRCLEFGLSRSEVAERHVMYRVM